MMRTTGPFASQIPLLIGIEILTIIAFILSLLTLLAGTSPNSLKQSAILTFNTLAINSAVPNASIPDWYEVNYLSICSGMCEIGTANKKQSTVICLHQKAGYTFSLAQTLSNDGTELLPINPSQGIIDTKAPAALLIAAIILAGISWISFLCGIVVMLATNTAPLNILRVGFLASITTVIFFMISSAKITVFADKMTGNMELGSGVVIHAWMGWAFYVSTWFGVGFIWAALSLSTAVAFKIADALQVQQSKSFILQHA